MIADDNQAFGGIFIMPFPQRGDHVAAINSAKCPHVEEHNLAA
jgi:hypothetical protein